MGCGTGGIVSMMGLVSAGGDGSDGGEPEDVTGTGAGCGVGAGRVGACRVGVSGTEAARRPATRREVLYEWPASGMRAVYSRFPAATPAPINEHAFCERKAHRSQCARHWMSSLAHTYGSVVSR